MKTRMVDDLVQGFRTTVAALCTAHSGRERIEAVNRAYEAVLCRTPHDLMEPVHEHLVTAMREHGVVQASRPAYF